MIRLIKVARASVPSVRNAISNKILAAGVALSASIPAFAQTDPFTTAVADVKDKVTTYGGELVAVAAVGVVFMIGIKYVKKIRGAA